MPDVASDSLFCKTCFFVRKEHRVSRGRQGLHSRRLGRLLHKPRSCSCTWGSALEIAGLSSCEDPKTKRRWYWRRDLRLLLQSSRLVNAHLEAKPCWCFSSCLRPLFSLFLEATRISPRGRRCNSRATSFGCRNWSSASWPRAKSWSRSRGKRRFVMHAADT